MKLQIIRSSGISTYNVKIVAETTTFWVVVDADNTSPNPIGEAVPKNNMHFSLINESNESKK